MKKAIKTIAMVLVIVMCANFAGCATGGVGFSTQAARSAAMGGSGGGGSGGGGSSLGGSGGHGSSLGGSGSSNPDGDSHGSSMGSILGVALVVIIVYALVQAVISIADAKDDNSVMLASGNQNTSFSDRFGQSSLIETFYAFPETENASFIETVNAIPQTDLIFGTNTPSETELTNTVWHLNLLSR